MLQFPEEYFEDEVRDGFYIPSMIKRAWATALDVLDEVDRICTKHNIKYYAEWGTLLGAVRHGGFIPWDDDLDIGMMRSDYIRFCEVAPKEFKEGFEIFTFRNHENFHHFLARVVCKNRICFEEEHLKRYHGFPYIVGLDIFVHDNVSKNAELQQKNEKTAEYIITAADSIAEGKVSYQEEVNIISKINRLCNANCRIQDDKEKERIALYEIADDIFAAFKDEECEEMTQMMPYSLYRHHMRIPVKYYKRLVRIPFENTTIPVPVGFDAMLRSRYGNYMKLVRNAGGHDYPFYESQKKQLEKLMDFKLPVYSYDERKAVRKQSDSAGLAGYRKILKESLENINNVIEKIGHTHEPESIKENLVDIQQAVIGMGNLIETMKGEGNKSVGCLEKFCDVIYMMYQGNKVDIKSEFTEVKRVIEEDVIEKKEVLILVSKVSRWKYMENIWRNIKSRKDIEVTVAVVPYCYKEYDGSIKKEVSELEGFDEGLSAVDVAEYDIAMHHPDVIYIQNPFDNENKAVTVSRQYYSDRLKACTDRLVYIQSFELEEFNEANEREYKNMSSYCTVPGVVNADAVYVQSDNMCDMYIKKLIGFAGENSEKVWKDKIHVKPEWMQNKEQHDVDGNRKKKILFYTSISGLMQNPDDAICKIKNVLEIFRQYSDRIDVLWCVQNLVDNVLKDIDSSMYEHIDKIRELYKMEKIGHICSSQDVDKINSCDAYYGDTSPAVQNYRNAGKPVMIIDYGV